ncbi:MAG: hypothetical protein KGD59_03960 [Candidatus Heimdallarchaeota archaeon]|nr:hypothetical protein [Candidatus Heimdallarchaeota archaeon]MBY8993680.1 hypothetical protein [Candidatus Heimdallarchaeota archaeon]
MCHLAGYIGNKNCIPIILESLEVQEAIIGAQATGLATMKDAGITMYKTIGPMKNFRELFKIREEPEIGIGHTRYAIKNVKNAETNTVDKAHPFWNSNKTFITMHNGTITNYMEFVEYLEAKGYEFRSKSEYYDKNLGEMVVDYCDSEIFGFLLEENLHKTDDIKEAIKKSCENFQGQFAFVVLHQYYPNQIFIANWMQPMYVGCSQHSSFFCSFEVGFTDVKALLPCKFEPPQNVLITLERNNVSVEQLLHHRFPPKFNSNKEDFSKIILEAIKNQQNDVAGIWVYIINNSEKIGLSKEEFNEISPINGLSFSPIIYDYLKKLEKDKVIERKLEYVWEGGIEETPRYKFYLKK